MLGTAELTRRGDGWWSSQDRAESFGFDENVSGQIVALIIRLGEVGSDVVRFNKVE